MLRWSSISMILGMPQRKPYSTHEKFGTSGGREVATCGAGKTPRGIRRSIGQYSIFDIHA